MPDPTASNKFARKTPPAKPTDAEIAAVAEGAPKDAPPAPPAVADKKAKAKDLTFSMSLPAEMADAIDSSCERLGLTRTAWLRLAAAEKLGWK